MGIALTKAVCSRKTVAADILGMRTAGSALFFPASQTGMLLLYKYFFAEKDTNSFLPRFTPDHLPGERTGITGFYPEAFDRWEIHYIYHHP